MTGQSLSKRVGNHVREQYQLPVEKVAVMLPTFLEVLKNHLNDLEQAVDGGVAEDIGRVGHTLKGALLNLGLVDIAEIAESIEKGGRSGRKGCNFVEAVGQLREKLQEIL